MESFPLPHLFLQTAEMEIALPPFQERLKENWQWFKSDARHFQILFLSSFLLYGVLELQWSTNWLMYANVIGIALFTQYYWCRKKGKHFTPKSALISALGLCLLFKANHQAVYALAAFAAISSKFLIRYKGKHIFNPANLGVILPILITSDGWISPGQWGNGGLLLFLLGVSGMFILHKVQRLDVCLTFLLTFGGLEFIRSVLYKSWPVDYWLHQFSSGSILLFTFFMITDPMTTPNAKKARILWAVLIGISSFILTEWFYVFTAPLWALFFSAPLTAFFNRTFKAAHFSWASKRPNRTMSPIITNSSIH